MQEFFIRKDSVNPVLCMELIKDGGISFHKSLIDEAIQDSVVTFTMEDEETGINRISKAKAEIVLAKDTNCEEKYLLQYKWKERDTKKCGAFNAWFDIKFNGNISSDGIDYPEGNLRVPVEEGLRIIIK